MNSRFSAMPAALRWGPPLGAATLLVALIPLIWRVNVNWDEFFFLSHVHDFARGSLTDVFQTAYVHLFGWLRSIPGGEVRQIVTARLVMWGLLAVTALMIWRLARHWSSALAAPVAPLAYLAASTVDRHGDAFRADSLLAPLTVATLLLFTREQRRVRDDVAAGACFGMGIALSVKAALLAPVLLCLAIAVRPNAGDTTGASRLVRACSRLIVFGVVAIAVAALVLVLHRLSLGTIHEGAAEFAARAGRTTLLDVPLFPRWAYFRETARTDLVTWIFIAFGTAGALWKRRWGAAACALSLLPVVFYRNAFSYYYVVMMAPACVLAAVGTDTLQSLIGRVTDDAVARRTVLALLTLLWLQGAVNLMELRRDFQAGERATLAAVHSIFPRPVPYIDHSGMVASFPKVNFFMSTWGMQEYRSRGVGFMRNAIEHHAPLLLANRGVLDPDSGDFRELLPQDQELIRRFYLPYWGAIYVAGAEVLLDPQREAIARFPYPGYYRLQTKMPVWVEGALRRDGDVIDVNADLQLHIRAAATATSQARVRFYIAEAGAPPKEDPPDTVLYLGL